jgi:hypothetical protein
MSLIKVHASTLFIICSFIMPLGLLSSGCCCVTHEPVTVNNSALPSPPKIPERVAVKKFPYSAEEKWRSLTDSERYFWRFSYESPSSTANPPETFDPLVMDLEVSENTALDAVVESDLVKNDVEFFTPSQKDNKDYTETENAEKDLDKIKAKAAFKFKKVESEELKRLVYRDALKAVKINEGKYPWH